MDKNNIIMKCCVCKRIKTDRGWQYRFVPVETGEFFSHGYCPVCYKKALSQLEIEETGAFHQFPQAPTAMMENLLEIAR